MGIMKKIPVSCNKDCGGGCPLLAHTEKGRITGITDNPAGSRYMTGCSRGFMGYLSLYAPNRLTVPLIRTGERGTGSFREASWDEALDKAVRGLESFRHSSRKGGLLRLGGSGSCQGALHNTNTLTTRFLNLFGDFTDRSGNYSAGAELFAMPFMFGSEPYGIDPKTLLKSRLIILWGMNPAETIFGCELRGYLREARKRGTPIVVIDPRKTPSVKQFATQWIPVFPGTDSVLMAAVLYELIHGNTGARINENFIGRYTTGFEKIKEYITGIQDGVRKTPDWAEKICGVEASVIRDFAAFYAGACPAALLPGLSIQRTLGGEEAARLGVVLQAVTGNIGVPGGSSGGNSWGRLPDPRCGKMAKLSRANTSSVPEYLWADAVLKGRSGGYTADIRGIYSVGGNFIVQGSDVRMNEEAFSSVDFVISHEIFMTPTAKWADIIFPATLPLEREDIVFAHGNFLLYSGAASVPPEGVKDDYEIFRLLAGGLGFENAFTEGKTPAQWIEKFLSESEIEDTEAFKETGIYFASDQERTGLSGFIRDPEDHSLDTPSGKIELSSAEYGRTGFPEDPRCRWMDIAEDYPLRLVTPHARLRINSQNSNIPWFQDRQDRALSMHPSDAASRSICSGDRVEIISRTGKLSAAVRVTDTVMKGVVSLFQGEWINPANTLTSAEPTMPSRSSRTHSTAVEVRSRNNNNSD